MNDSHSATRPRWMEELDRRLLRRLHELEQENQLLRRDLRQTKEKLDFVMSEGRRVLTARMQEVANLKKEMNGLQEQLHNAAQTPHQQNNNRPKAMPPRRPAPMVPLTMAKIISVGRPS